MVHITLDCWESSSALDSKCSGPLSLWFPTPTPAWHCAPGLCLLTGCVLSDACLLGWKQHLSHTMLDSRGSWLPPHSS